MDIKCGHIALYLKNWEIFGDYCGALCDGFFDRMYGVSRGEITPLRASVWTFYSGVWALFDGIQALPFQRDDMYIGGNRTGIVIPR